MNEWLATITDESLRKKVKSNLLVSGGSITSMFLNEKINDFDIYIKDMDVLVDLTAYYTKKYSDIKVLDGRYKNALETELEKKYHGAEMADIDNAYAISLRNLKADQVKLFFVSEKGGIKVNEGKKPEELNYF
jgi:hypothetical protein